MISLHLILALILIGLILGLLIWGSVRVIIGLVDLTKLIYKWIKGII
jgi:hypothetical protein